MEFYDDLMNEQYDVDFLYSLFDEYVSDYGYDGLLFLSVELNNYIFINQISIKNGRVSK